MEAIATTLVLGYSMFWLAWSSQPVIQYKKISDIQVTVDI